jgi:HEAT repeat protein
MYEQETERDEGSGLTVWHLYVSIAIFFGIVMIVLGHDILWVDAGVFQVDQLPYCVGFCLIAVIVIAFAPLLECSVSALEAAAKTGNVRFGDAPRHVPHCATALKLIGKMGPAARGAVPDIKNVLDYEYWDVRANAIRALSALDLYIKALDDPHGHVRGTAIVALGKMGTGAKDAIPALIRSLSDDEPGWGKGIRLSALYALSSIDPSMQETVPAFLQALDDNKTDTRDLGVRRDETDIREYAVRMLGKKGQGNTAVTAVLIRAVDDDPNYFVKLSAVSALGDLGLEAAGETVPVLKKALEDKTLRPNAERALRKIKALEKKAALKWIYSAIYAVCAALAIGGIAVVTGIVVFVVKKLKRKRSPATGSKGAANLLSVHLIAAAGIGAGVAAAPSWFMETFIWLPPGVTLLIIAAIGVVIYYIGWRIFDPVSWHTMRLRSKHSSVREKAAEALRYETLSNEQVIWAYVHAMRSNSMEAHLSAVEALHKLNATEHHLMLGYTEALLRSGRDVSIAAAEALGSIGDENAIDDLVRYLELEAADPWVSEAVGKALVVIARKTLRKNTAGDLLEMLQDQLIYGNPVTEDVLRELHKTFGPPTASKSKKKNKRGINRFVSMLLIPALGLLYSLPASAQQSKSWPPLPDNTLDGSDLGEKLFITFLIGLGVWFVGALIYHITFMRMPPAPDKKYLSRLKRILRSEISHNKSLVKEIGWFDPERFSEGVLGPALTKSGDNIVKILDMLAGLGPDAFPAEPIIKKALELHDTQVVRAAEYALHAVDPGRYDLPVEAVSPSSMASGRIGGRPGRD